MATSTDGSKFIYLLNAMEVAAQADDPSRLGYAEKRRAVLDYVANLERSGGPKCEQWNEAIEAAATVCDAQAIKQAQGAEGDMERYRKARAWDAHYLSARIRDLKRTDATQEKP